MADRLAFAYRFFKTNNLRSFLNKVVEEAKAEGNLGALYLTGKGEDTNQIIQQYIDNTGDIQSVALIGVYLNQQKMESEFCCDLLF